MTTFPNVDKMRDLLDRQIAALTPKERAILDARVAARAASWKGRLEAILSAKNNDALRDPISAADRHRVRRMVRAIVVSLLRRAKRVRRERHFIRDWKNVFRDWTEKDVCEEVARWP